MKYPRLLLRLLLLSLPAVLVLAAADVPAAHRSGCPSTCGNVDIPYPFGIGDQCAINPFFGINCAVVNGTERPYKGPFEVTKISVHEAKAWMKMGISWQCGLDARQSVWSQYFTHTPFRFSYVDNKIVVVGCNTLAYMKSEPHIVGCYATCSDSIPKNGSCIATAGCCEADVPEDLGYFEAYFNKNYNTSFGCGYIVVIEEKAFSYSTTYADQTKTEFWDAYKGQVPVVMDWVITRDDACNVATTKNQSSYACLSNDSHCVSSTNGRGTRCKCDDGYEGNPYIKDGCTDIDECSVRPSGAFVKIHGGTITAHAHQENKKQMVFAWQFRCRRRLLPLQVLLG